tara:strand:+ start:2818 stop:3609 length:792 start_codon:yes stop_codon:yes gene_type:complete
MPINYPDNIKSNNPNYPIIKASDTTVQGYAHVADITARNAFPANKRLEGNVIVVGQVAYIYGSSDLGDTAWQTASNWTSISAGLDGNTGPAGTGDTGPQGSTGNTGAVDVSYQSTAPTGASAGEVWFNSTSGLFFVYVNDGDSNQWVQIVGSPGPTGGAQVSSYTGQIEAPIVKEYTLDPYVASARTITGYYITSTAGTATAILKHTTSGGSTVTILSASVTNSSGVFSITNNLAVAAGSRLWLDVTAISTPENVSFSVSYTE